MPSIRQVHQPISFGSLNHLRLEIGSPASFQQVVDSMEDRFGGLPNFHRSVDLRIHGQKKLVVNRRCALTVPLELERLAQPHLVEDLRDLVEFVNRAPGSKSLGYLKLGIRLNPRHLEKHVERHCRGSLPILRRALSSLGSRVEVPICLAVASRQRGRHYESLAVGIRGLTRYSSSIFLSTTMNQTRFVVEGGLSAVVNMRDIDHPISGLLPLFQVLPSQFFNEYVQKYMLPERPIIVQRLCDFVFDKKRFESKAPRVPNDSTVNRWLPA